MRVVYLTNISSPYRVNYFNILGKSVDLTVIYEHRVEPTEHRDSSWKKANAINYKAEYDFRLGRLKNFDIVVICGISEPKEILALLYLKILKIPYMLEIDGGIPKNDNYFKKKIKSFLIKGAMQYFSTSQISDNYLLKYGADENRINRYPFTSLYDHDILKTVLTEEEKLNYKHKLRINEEKMIVSVGRFSYQAGYGKGYDTLFRIASKLKEDVGIYIVGDEPTEEFKRWKEREQLNNIHFIPFVQKSGLFEYYRAADISVLLTRGDVWGLVVNEAMANSCPVITTDACVAGVELIKNGLNGYVVPVNNADATAEIINHFFESRKQQRAMAENSLKTIGEYTFENMVDKHLKVFMRVEKTNGYMDKCG